MTGKLTTLDISPAPGRPTSSPKRVLWKLSLAATSLILLFLAWQCDSAFREGRSLANVAVRQFHEKLNQGRYEEIYREADEGFSRPGKHDQMVRFLEAVHVRLGNAGAANLANMRVNATTGGTFIVAQYNTTFDQGSAVETFTWIRSRGALKLSGYNIQSNAPLEDKPAAVSPDAVDLENGNLHLQIPVIVAAQPKP
jgi:hypothetical protein